jgi:tetratricopeptide (TPR) repeat protein
MDANVSKSQIRDELRSRWAQRAVDSALMGHWDEAVQTNLRILELYPDDIHTRNRLGRAYLELGRLEEAAATYEHTLQEQPTNTIARKKLVELYALLERTPNGDFAETSEGEDSEESVGEIDDALEDAIAESIED